MWRTTADLLTPGKEIRLDGRWRLVTSVSLDGDVVDVTAGRATAALQAGHIVAVRLPQMPQGQP